MSGRFAVDRQPVTRGNAHAKHRGKPGTWHNPLPLAIPSVRDAAERIPSNDTALRADDLHLLVNDRPRSPVNAERWPAGGSHARAVRTQIVRSLGGDGALELNMRLQVEIGEMLASDNLASPNQAPKRRQVVHSAGRDVQRHVISESVTGELLPMRQVADASEATYETIDVQSLPSRALTLSDLRLELGVKPNDGSNRSFFVMQLEAAIHALEMLVAIEKAIDSGKLIL